MKSILPIDLRKQYQAIQPEIDTAISRVLESGQFILGEQVACFEQQFAAYCGANQAIGVSSGTDALRLALLASGVVPGDEVITVSNAAIADVSAIEDTGARPILVDIEPQWYTIDPQKAIAAITPQTRAIIAVHLYGCPAELAPLLDEAHLRHIPVIEDCAQAHGAVYCHKKVGSWGDVATFSFYPTKNLGAYGDAGAIVTSNDDLAGRVRLLRQFGWKERYVSQIRGFNSRMDDLQAAILTIKLGHLEEWNRRRRFLAQVYTTLLTGTGLILPCVPEDATHVYHQYVIQSPNRDGLCVFLKENGIHTLIHYPMPVHLQPAYLDLGYHAGDLPVTEGVARRILSLPLYPEMAEGDVRRVCEVIRIFLHKMESE